ncbi:hypothetical protein AGLY_003356 [Aphis glycines]|uniref:Uncharacterized protein n=1 Tax=Aphis glycines TaxID=307491 RepID=A0A6G0U075_APHGL|nr:hypothetical protein AGLY_003356 [Aphis glycines]
MCFVTTSSNTGKNRESCVLLERKLGKNLFWLACRHHIFELLIGAAFQAALPLATSGPDNRLFERFQSYWSEINQSTYITANQTIILRITDEKRNDIVKFCQEMLQIKQVRDDYRELLELFIMFLGKKPTRGIRFMTLEFGVDNFWESDVVNWNESKSFKKAENVFKNFRVTNDVVEREVALIQDLNHKITHDENQLQFLLQVVSEHWMNYPDFSADLQKRANKGEVDVEVMDYTNFYDWKDYKSTQKLLKADLTLLKDMNMKSNGIPNPLAKIKPCGVPKETTNNILKNLNQIFPEN